MESLYVLCHILELAWLLLAEITSRSDYLSHYYISGSPLQVIILVRS
jgi:hypothetical protein